MTSFPQTGSASVDIDASPDAVWNLVSDVTRMAEWSPECIRAEWVDGASSAKVGAESHGYNRLGTLEWDMRCVITECEPRRRFAFSVPPDSPHATLWRFDLTPAGTGTRLTESFDAPIINVEGSVGNYPERCEMLVEGARTTLQNIKLTAEAQG
jgi:uncharacterized protein YndB with AHSA1/START domain